MFVRWRVALLAACAMAPGVIDAKPYTYVALHDQSAVAVYDHGSSAWLGSIAVGTAPVA